MDAEPSTAPVERGEGYRNCTVRHAVKCLSVVVVPGVTPERWMTPSSRRPGAIETMVGPIRRCVKPGAPPTRARLPHKAGLVRRVTYSTKWLCGRVRERARPVARQEEVQ